MIVISWDWKAQPEWYKLNAALKDWKGPLVFNKVDTKSDCYAVIIAHGYLSSSEAWTVYKYWAENGVVPDEEN